MLIKNNEIVLIAIEKEKQKPDAMMLIQNNGMPPINQVSGLIDLTYESIFEIFCFIKPSI